MPFPSDAQLVSAAMRDARQAVVYRLSGLGAARIVATDPATGNVTIDDGAGNLVVNDPSGANVRLMMSLGKPVAWLQPPVYIAAGVGLVLGFVAMLKFGGK